VLYAVVMIVPLCYVCLLNGLNFVLLFPPCVALSVPGWLLLITGIKTLEFVGCGSSVLTCAYGALGTLVPTGTSEVRLPLAISSCVAHECSVLVRFCKGSVMLFCLVSCWLLISRLNLSLWLLPACCVALLSLVQWWVGCYVLICPLLCGP
jgi:hypothetical protein